MDTANGQVGNDDNLLAVRTSLAFTPVNQGQAVIIPMHHDVSHWAQGIERKNIYDFPERHCETARLQKKRKRAPPNPIHADASTQHLEVLRPSDAKSHPKGFVRTMESAESNFLQLKTPPESRRKSVQMQSLSHRQKQPELLVLPVTKSHRRSKRADTEGIRSMVICHTTTEDMIRFGNNTLGQSTVKKLANFMYNRTSVTPSQKPGATAAEDARADTFKALFEFKSSAELQEDEVTEVDQLSFFKGLSHAPLGGSPFGGAARSSGLASRDLMEPGGESAPQRISDIDMSSDFIAAACGAAELPKVEDISDESNAFQDQELQDEDLWAIADSVVGNVSENVRLGDEIRLGTVVERGTEMANLQFSPNLDVDGCFPIDEDAELGMTTLNLDMFESNQRSTNPKLASASSFQQGVLDMSLQLYIHSPPKSDIASIKWQDIVSHDECHGRTTQESLLSHYQFSLLGEVSDCALANKHGMYANIQMSTSSELGPSIASKDEGSHDGRSDYSPMRPFARPDFPLKVRDRSPVTGFSSNSFLRTCFRIGEAIRTSGICNAQKQDMVIELFARIKCSSRESGTVTQHFQFADLFHDRPPYLIAILENFKVSALQETESGKLVGEDKAGQLVRSLGRLTKAIGGTGRMFHVVNVRATDWEEVRWTRMIAGAGMVKSVVEFGS